MKILAITAYKIAQVVNHYIQKTYPKRYLDLDIQDLTYVLSSVSIEETIDNFSMSPQEMEGATNIESQQRAVRRRKGTTTGSIRRWLRRNGYNYTDVRKGVYIDEHKRKDVVAYREEFVNALEKL